MNRPKTNHARTGANAVVTTPNAGVMIDLLGPGIHTEAVLLSRDEWKHVKRLYGYTPEKPTPKPPEPVDPGPDASWEAQHKYNDAKRAWDRWEDPRPMMQAGADRNALRHAACDGMRLLAWIAKHVEPGEDPLKTLVQMAIGAGFDVDPEDYGWATSVQDEETADEAEEAEVA